MIRTVASVKKDIDELMHQRDEIYQKELVKIDTLIETHRQWIKQNCRHQEDNLIIKEHYVADEFGNYRGNLADYVVTCSACGKTEIVNKAEFDSSKGTFSQAMNDFNKLIKMS